MLCILGASAGTFLCVFERCVAGFGPLSVPGCRFQDSLIIPSVQTWDHTGREKADPWKWTLELWLRSFPTLLPKYLPTAGQLMAQESRAAPLCSSSVSMCGNRAPPPLSWAKEQLWHSQDIVHLSSCWDTQSGMCFSGEPRFPRSPLHSRLDA